MKNQNNICKCGKETKFIDEVKGYAINCSNKCKYKFFPKRKKIKMCLYCNNNYNNSKFTDFCCADCKNNHEISKYNSIEDFIITSSYIKDKSFLRKYKLKANFVYNILNPNIEKECPIHKSSYKFISIRDGYKKCTECNKILGLKKAALNKLKNRNSNLNLVDEYILEIAKNYKKQDIIRPKDIAKEFDVSTTYVTKFIQKNNLSYILHNNRVFHIDNNTIIINKKAINVSGILYSIKITDNSTNEIFYKVGITTNTVNKRFSKENIKVEILDEYYSNIKDCFDKEQIIHRNNRDLSFIPKNRIVGYTECYSEQIEIK